MYLAQLGISSQLFASLFLTFATQIGVSVFALNKLRRPEFLSNRVGGKRETDSTVMH